ncbi:MAG: LysR family transcriptional regulator [Bulleidia sp.]
MNQEQIRIFLAAADCRSFSGAEETMYMSRQAMLKQINHLEAEIGCKLFLRSHAGLVLTPAGKEFYQGAGKLLREQENLIQKCRRASEEQTLRIGNVEHQVLLDCVTEAYIKLYPGIRIQRVAHPNHSGEWRVDHDIIDVGESFLSDRTPPHQYVFTELTRVPYVAAMSPEHPLSEKKTVSLKDLSGYQTVCFRNMLMESYLDALKAAFRAHPENLILRDDVDHQVEAAYACMSDGTILITANLFLKSISGLHSIPLSEGWERTYGIIYKTPVSDAVQKYIDLAQELYRR